MQKMEWLKVVGVINNLYPQQNLFATEEVIDTWYEALKDLPCELVKENAIKHSTESRFPPAICDLREVKVADDDWSKGWEEIQLAIRKYGAWRKEEALNSLSPRTRLIVERFGWEDFCYTENPDVLKAQFRDTFNENLKREQREVKIPAEFRIGGEDVKALQGN